MRSRHSSSYAGPGFDLTAELPGVFGLDATGLAAAAFDVSPGDFRLLDALCAAGFLLFFLALRLGAVRRSCFGLLCIVFSCFFVSFLSSCFIFLHTLIP